MNAYSGFTVDKDPDIDRSIASDLEYIVSEVLTLFKDDKSKIEAIVLSGGFGRGEGGVIFRDDRPVPINDYDLTVIVKGFYLRLYRKYQKRLVAMAARVAQEIGIKQIDIGLRNIRDLPNMPLTIENYEFREGHMVLWGEIDLCSIMPQYDPARIPLFEGTWLFRNRGGGLLLAAKYITPDGGVPEHKKQDFGVECDKAILAMGDSILLLRGQYHFLHEKRKELIRQLDIDEIPSAKDIVPMYVEALEDKVRPHEERYSQIDPREWWYRIRDLYERFFHYFEERRLERRFSDWGQYAVIHKPESQASLKARSKSFVRDLLQAHSREDVLKSLSRRADKAYLIELMALLLFAIKKDGYNDSYLYKAWCMLGMNSNTGNDHRMWTMLTDEFLSQWHPEGAVTEVVGNHN